MVFAVDDVLGAFAASALIRRSIMLRALPPSSIAFLICGATILAAVPPADEPPLLILSATGSFSTIVGIEDCGAGFDTADFHGVIVRIGVGAGGGFELLSITVDCVDIGLGVPESPALLPSLPDRFSGGGSGSARFISFADACRLVTSCSSARMITSAVLVETSGASARRGGKLNGGSS